MEISICRLSQVRVRASITDLFSQEELDAINYESLARGSYLSFGKFYTNFGIAAAAQRLAEAVINDSHEEMPVSNYRPEYGTYLGYPAIVGRKGIIERLDLHLTEEEKENYSIQPKPLRKIHEKGWSMHKERRLGQKS